MASCSQYEAFETILKTVITNCPVYQANMPFAKMDEMTRAESKTATFHFQQDVERINTSGATGVHNVLVELNLFGPLADIDVMAKAVTGLFLNDEPVFGGWRFVLTVGEKRDIWEAGIKSKRIWMQLPGLMIMEE